MMKHRLFLVAVATLLCLSVQAQVLDGMPQGKSLRIMLPISVSIDSGEANFTPYVGYRIDLPAQFNVSLLSQYNVAARSFTPQLWIAWSALDKLYLMSRSQYNSASGLFSEGLSATAFVFDGLHLDLTWDGIATNDGFSLGSRIQSVVGYNHPKFVINAGYSFYGKMGFVANFRWRFTPENWLQLKHDGALKTVTISSVINLNFT